MPEFEEPEAAPSSKQDYTPSVDASDKPRTRRRSGGFKTAPPVPSTGMGEIDPAEALKKEKLSGGSKPKQEAKKEKSASKTDKPAPKKERTDSNVGNAQPSPETLAAIQSVETRIAERRKERDARKAERDKNRPNKNGKKSGGKQSSPNNKGQSGGVVASILSFFGLGPKEPAKKKGGQGRSSGNRGKGTRSSGKGGKRPQGQNRRGGKGRRSGGKGQRRNDRPGSGEKS